MAHPENLRDEAEFFIEKEFEVVKVLGIFT
jgi:hypothetical protein